MQLFTIKTILLKVFTNKLIRVLRAYSKHMSLEFKPLFIL